jgi:hypothetical protein
MGVMRVKKTMSREGRSFASVRETKEIASFKRRKKKKLSWASTRTRASIAQQRSRVRTHGQQPAINRRRKEFRKKNKEQDVAVVGDDEWLSLSLSLSH